MIVLVCTEGEQMEECDDTVYVCAEGKQVEECDVTASPNDVSPFKNFGSEVDPNYSLSVYSYSDSSDSESSSLHEGKFFVEWNKIVHSTTQKEIWKANGRKKEKYSITIKNSTK